MQLLNLVYQTRVLTLNIYTKMCSKNFGTFKNFVTGVICSHLLAVQSLSGTRYNSEKIEKPVKTGRKQCLKDLSKSGSNKKKSEKLISS